MHACEQETTIKPYTFEDNKVTSLANGLELLQRGDIALLYNYYYYYYHLKKNKTHLAAPGWV